MRQFLVDKDFFGLFNVADATDLQRLGDLYRINCLAGLKAANHGWLGACFSSMELLTCIYHRYIPKPMEPLANRGALHMSKGHAAMAQYAILAGLGCIEIDKLLTYKQRNGLPAHCDRAVAGVDSDSGSLGQGLSKAVGNALSNQASGQACKPVFAIMGDGELQEGQLFEALLTLSRHNPRGIVPIVDRNCLQSDSQTKHIKDAESWHQVFTGTGLRVHEIDGHAVPQILNAIDKVLADAVPAIIIANTNKGGGTALTSMPRDIKRRQGVWHGQIPTDAEYLTILDELVARVALPELDAAYSLFKSQFKPQIIGNGGAGVLSTGEAFAHCLESYAKDPDIFVLDADLEKACKLAPVADAFAERFIEMGISEQDMVSVAAGIGLTGKVAVANTYGAFFRRALDQIFAVATEGVPVIFAAHYSGVDYFTDGKSHQSVTDIGLMRTIGTVELVEPICENTTNALLRWSIEKMRADFKAFGRCKPVYFRLHRTACTDLPAFEDDNLNYKVFKADKPETMGVLFVSGPHMLRVALNTQKQVALQGIYVDVVAVLRYSDDSKKIKQMIADYKNIFTLEDHRRETGLGGFIGSLGFKNPVRIGVRDYSQSSLDLEDMKAFHSINEEHVSFVIKKVNDCKDHK